MFVFVILLIMILSAFTITAISVSTLKSARNGEYIAKTQYAVDRGVEEAMFDYNWSDPNGDPVCDNKQIETDDGIKVNLQVDDGQIDQGTEGTNQPDHCPAPADVIAKQKMLCVYAFAESNGIQKKRVSAAGSTTPGCPVR